MTEDFGLKLLAAVEALNAELKALRDERDATKTLQRQKANKAARQARWRAKSRSVSVDTTAQVLDLDLKQRSRNQDQRLPRSIYKDATPPTKQTWESYRAAYRKRHNVEPVRNQRVNGQLAQLVGRLGAEEAPPVAAFYLTLTLPKYLTNRHPVGLLLQDCEGIRTQWASGKRATATEARQQDQTQANYDGWADLMSQEGRDGLVRR